MKALDEVKEKILRKVFYLSFIAQGTLLKPQRYREFRVAILEICSDYFQFGADPLEKMIFQRQAAFLEFNVATECMLSLHKSPMGYKSLLDQIAWYTKLHRPIHLRKCNVRCVDYATGDVFTLTQDLDVMINYDTIKNMFRHMLSNFGFMQKVVGKVLSFTLVLIVKFSPTNKIQSITIEHSYAQSWKKLLNDQTLVEEMFRAPSIDNALTL